MKWVSIAFESKSSDPKPGSATAKPQAQRAPNCSQPAGCPASHVQFVKARWDVRAVMAHLLVDGGFLVFSQIFPRKPEGLVTL